jgi:glutamate-1-semialdehyde 2,1-aminomutase
MADRSRTFARSRAYHQRAARTLAGGVASALRAQQLPWPLTFERGAGAHLFDVDGNDYIDYVLAYGPMLLGHSPESVLTAVRRQLGKGIGFGASHRWEGEAAEAVCRTVPSAERVVFSTTGTEAAMVAIRIARCDRPPPGDRSWGITTAIRPLHVGACRAERSAPATGGQGYAAGALSGGATE